MLALRRSLRNLVEFSFPSLVSTAVVSISMLLVGTFLLILINLSSVMDRWGRDVQVYAYFADGVGEESRFRIKEEIEGRPEVAHVHYVSPEEALETFRRLFEGADELLADLETNPLPPSLEIRLKSSLRDPGGVSGFAASIQRPELLEVDYAGEWVARFYTFLNLLKLSAVVLGALLAFSCVVIVANTIQLTIWARRDEIEILRLVGATEHFVEAPFLIEGAIQGLVGSAIGVGLLVVLYEVLFVQLRETMGLALGERVLSFLPLSHCGAFLLSGLLLGLIGSWLGVRRMLERSR